MINEKIAEDSNVTPQHIDQTPDIDGITDEDIQFIAQEIYESFNELKGFTKLLSLTNFILKTNMIDQNLQEDILQEDVKDNPKENPEENELKENKENNITNSTAESSLCSAVFFDEEIEHIVRGIYKDFLIMSKEEQLPFNILCAFKVKAMLPLEGDLPEDLAYKIVKQFDKLSEEEQEKSVNDEKYEFLADVTRKSCTAYNAVIATNGKYKDLVSDFLLASNKNHLSKNLAHDTYLEQIFQSLYGYYRGRAIPRKEIDDLKTLQIALPVSRTETAMNSIFGCCSKTGTSKALKMRFRDNIRVLTEKLFAMEEEIGSNEKKNPLDLLDFSQISQADNIEIRGSVEERDWKSYFGENNEGQAQKI